MSTYCFIGVQENANPSNPWPYFTTDWSTPR